MFGSTGLSPKSPPSSTWSPGTYSLINARSNTAADLSGGDDKSIIGYSLHGRENQQWEFIPSGNRYVIRSLRTPPHIGRPVYMSVEGEVKEKALVVAITQRTEWTVEQTNQGLRISWPNSNLVIEMGNGTEGQQLVLQTLALGDIRQLWRFVRRPRSEAPPQPEWESWYPTVNGAETLMAQTAVTPTTTAGKDVGVVVESARAVSDPTTTETVATSESEDYITTTRTTVTTVITTVTEVIRTPKAPLQR